MPLIKIYILGKTRRQFIVIIKPTDYKNCTKVKIVKLMHQKNRRQFCTLKTYRLTKTCGKKVLQWEINNQEKN